MRSPNGQEWIKDQGGESFAHVYRVDAVLHDHSSPFQRVRVIENLDFGRMLILDEAVQTSERDEFIYHELLAHIPLCTHPAPRRVLIIGGGDGGLLRETLRHPIEHATMVEIDREVIEATLRWIPSIPARCYEDPRARLLVDDGIRFVRETGERFDVAMVDSTDPKGPSLGLFSGEFYGQIAGLLGDAGVLAVQSGSPIYQQDLIAMVRRHMAPHFRWVRTYMGAVPSYPGTFWTFTAGSQDRDPAEVTPEELAGRMRSIHTRYYLPAEHRNLFVPPPFLQEALSAG